MSGISDNGPTRAQAERIAQALERIADALETRDTYPDGATFLESLTAGDSTPDEPLPDWAPSDYIDEYVDAEFPGDSTEDVEWCDDPECIGIGAHHHPAERTATAREAYEDDAAGSSANEQKAESRGSGADESAEESSQSAEIPTLGHDTHSQLRKPKRQCPVSNPEIAGGNQCVLDAGHSGHHESIYAGRLYPWSPI